MQLAENKRSRSFLIAEISAIRQTASRFQTPERAHITMELPKPCGSFGFSWLVTNHSPLITAFKRATRKLEFQVTRLRSTTSKFLIDNFWRVLQPNFCNLLVFSTLVLFAAFPTFAQSRSLRASHASAATAQAVGQSAASTSRTKMLGFTAASAANEQSVEKQFLPLASTKQIRTFHRYLTAEPHPAGSTRNNDLAKWVAQQWREQGL